MVRSLGLSNIGILALAAGLLVSISGCVADAADEESAGEEGADAAELAATTPIAIGTVHFTSNCSNTQVEIGKVSLKNETASKRRIRLGWVVDGAVHDQEYLLDPHQTILTGWATKAAGRNLQAVRLYKFSDAAHFGWQKLEDSCLD